MGPIAVVCLMLLWPLLGWAEKASPHSYKPGSQTCLYDGAGQIIIPGDLPIHHLSAYVVDCLNRSGEASKAQDIETSTSGLYIGDGKKSVEIEKLAIETAKMVGFEYVEPSYEPRVICVGELCGPTLIAKCFPYPTDTEAPFPSVSCQVYAGQTGKILNLECRYDGCMVTGVLDVHQ